ncbi:hypothetical protein CNE_2c02610 [Cupriavidus necator N-1]|uniref:Uncharacterized protein n=1 Tax=Cupriavidus necator (strain ATCC 43291 / DSM 13513 / CCUG 52238 / LMG 8453 / N-1) TaxID=1042878 RepID=F8GPG5_CUPNN|nr:hypothetical protein CNE_2c02610 [Cupriavidus necator N-1]KAI3597355.1 hypothetical protein D8I24_6815 [Cupriavidus necator H850]
MRLTSFFGEFVEASNGCRRLTAHRSARGERVDESGHLASV